MNAYFNKVSEDVREYINDNIDLTEYAGQRDELEEQLNDNLWNDDSITGNASGSYFCNSWKAREAVLEDMQTVSEALREFCIDAAEIGERFLNEDWEWLDVTARCYVLGQAIHAVLDDIEETGALDEIEEEEEAAA